MERYKELKDAGVFKLGEKIENEYFSGDAWLNMLVQQEDSFQNPIGNVTFSPTARNHWHVHPGGQILLVTGGEGWYQEEGKDAIKLHMGDVVKILPMVKHWHGAGADSWFTHLAIDVDASAGAVVWLESVVDSQYESAIKV